MCVGVWLYVSMAIVCMCVYMDECIYIICTCYGIIFVCLFVVLHNSNNISVISWQCYDIWDEEKARAYAFTHWQDLEPPTSYRHDMRGTGLWACIKLYIAGKWIAAGLNVIAVTRIHTPVPRAYLSLALTNWAVSPHLFKRGVCISRMQSNSNYI